MAAPAAVVNIDAMDQQFRPHVTNVLNAELHFVKKLCGPTAEQYKVIKAAGKEEANAVIRKLAQFQAQNNNRGIPNWPSPRKLLSDKLATVLETAQIAGGGREIPPRSRGSGRRAASSPRSITCPPASTASWP